MEGTNANLIYLPVITTAVLLAVSCVAFLVRGWVKHVDKSLDALWQEIAESRRERESKLWELQNNHAATTERLARIEGKLNGALEKK